MAKNKEKTLIEGYTLNTLRNGLDKGVHSRIKINEIGRDWEKQSAQSMEIPTVDKWEDVLPSMDIWLQVTDNELHHVCHLLPTLDWKGDLLGVRLRFEPKEIKEFYKDYLSARKMAEETGAQKGKESKLKLWPRTMREFLDKQLNSLFKVKAYILDPAKCDYQNGKALPQPLPLNSESLDKDPFRGLILIDEIVAQRGLSDVENKGSQSGNDEQQDRQHSNKRKLSDQLRAYYTKHLDPYKLPVSEDLDALKAIDEAQNTFDKRLADAFKKAMDELESLGYPGLTDPKLTISTKIRPMDSLNHPSAVQFEVGNTQGIPLRLPEQYNGLGYQNLIAMVFKLMSFRDGWMQVRKADKRTSGETESSIEPLHLVLVEEPEAHLHAQVQQVFIRKAYDVLRHHEYLGGNSTFKTQLIISTHSSHIAHESDFSNLRYFRRMPAQKGSNKVPISSVVNLSDVFGANDDTQNFVTRYLKLMHSDLFFADAAILVEGSAERMFIPYFIREHFKELSQAYITVLEIGGSHAHRLSSLIEALGLITLVITDLDTSEPKNNVSVQPVRGQKQITQNPTLKKWFPQVESVDILLNLSSEKKVKRYQLSSICVAYQCPFKINLNNKSNTEDEALSNTFEDALVYENLEIFRSLQGKGLIKKFREALQKSKSSYDLGKIMFDALKEGKKAEFALEILNSKELDNLKVPTYINEGLLWLQRQVRVKQKEILNPNENSTQESEG
ncbi:MAG: AAA family ATPase [Nitrospirae bacterium]|nr:AAA family ATPase [Nitrospirota bacterium]